MFTSTINRGKIGAAGLVFGAALALSAGYGLMVVNGVTPEIWKLNGNTVTTFPTTRAVQVDGTFNATATSTIARSYDGFIAGGGIAPANVATGTVKTVYTHSGGRSLCRGSDGVFYADSTAFSPSVVLSMGTSTTAAASTNLIASTTLATTTDTVINTAGSFVMEANDKINILIDDTMTSGASSTHFANWDIEYQVPCALIGG